VPSEVKFHNRAGVGSASPAAPSERLLGIQDAPSHEFARSSIGFRLRFNDAISYTLASGNQRHSTFPSSKLLS